MKKCGILWKYVLVYAPMSSTKAEKTVGTMNKSITEMMREKRWDRTSIATPVLSGYRQKAVSGKRSPLQVLYGVLLRFTGDDMNPLGVSTEDMECGMSELPTVQSRSAYKAYRHFSDQHISHKPCVVQFYDGDEILVARGKAFGSTKMMAFETKWQGPCLGLQVQHPLYMLRSKGDKFSRSPVHARRLRLYYRCLEHLSA